MDPILRSILSPEARKYLLDDAPVERITVLVETGSTTLPPALTQGCEKLDAEILSWSPQAKVLTLSLDSNRLADIAALRGVMAITTGGRYGPEGGASA